MSDPYLTLAQIADTIPGARGAARVSGATLTRWITHGCPARDGTRVKLVATRAGQRWLVKQSDLDDFFRALAGEMHPAPVNKPTDAASRKAAERADSELAKAGC